MLDALQEPHVDAGAAGQLGRLGAAAQHVDQREQAAVVGLVTAESLDLLGELSGVLRRSQELPTPTATPGDAYWDRHSEKAAAIKFKAADWVLLG